MGFLFGTARRLVFWALVLFLGLWTAFGWRLAQDWTAAWCKPRKSETENLLVHLEKRDAEAAREIRDLQTRSDARAVAAALTETERLYGLDGLKELARTSKERGKPTVVELAELALDPKRNSSQEQREAVLLAHGPALQVLHSDGQSAADYVAALKRASADPSAWAIVRDDPVGLAIWTHVKDAELLSYYAAERDWLAEVLSDVVDSPERLETALKVARECHPLPKTAAVEMELGAPGFELFLDYCPILHEAVSVKGLPLDEVLEVAFANRDFLDDAKKREEPKATAARLADMRANRRAVWKHARQSALALRLHTAAPEVANRLLEKFGADDVAAFLFTAYEHELPVAAQTVDRFGDLGLYILNKYRDDERTHRYLADPSVGVRLAPYLARFGDSGLDRLAANRAWLDKYFAADGSERSKEWWTQIPGGAALDVARNWSKGTPNEWSELGWGAVDVADAALLVLSFGSSAPASAGKQAAKRAVIAGVERSASTAGRGARLAAREAMAVGRGSSLLRRSAAAVKTASIAVVRTALRPAQFAGQSVRRAAAGWSALPVRVRVYTARALLGAGLFVTLKNRTLPMIGDSAREAFEKVARAPLETLGEGLRAALAALGVDANTVGTAVGLGLYVAGIFLLMLSAWVVKPRRRLVYVTR